MLPNRCSARRRQQRDSAPPGPTRWEARLPLAGHQRCWLRPPASFHGSEVATRLCWLRLPSAIPWPWPGRTAWSLRLPPRRQASPPPAQHRVLGHPGSTWNLRTQEARRPSPRRARKPAPHRGLPARAPERSDRLDPRRRRQPLPRRRRPGGIRAQDLGVLLQELSPGGHRGPSNRLDPRARRRSPPASRGPSGWRLRCRDLWAQRPERLPEARRRWIAPEPPSPRRLYPSPLMLPRWRPTSKHPSPRAKFHVKPQG